MASVMWFRRDLRLYDHPALQAAASNGPVLALFVLDPALLRPSGAARLAFLAASLRSLDEDLRSLGGRLVIRSGDPVRVLPEVVGESGASSVHVSADFGPYGARRDAAVEDALDVPLVRTGSPYAIAPGRVLKQDGTPYRVYTPFYRAWREHGWRAPIDRPSAQWAQVDGEPIPDAPALPEGMTLPAAGESAARSAWRAYLRSHAGEYADVRDRPDLDQTSRMSGYLKWGAIHPRTLLADLSARDETLRKEIAWREFYAAVLHAWPDSARGYFQPELAAMQWSAPGASFDAWRDGRTGYPIVDAGMRQLLGQGWMHNRVRMIVASFLVKDLHVEWTHGARHFMRHLVDGDLASNQHGWQWTAGTGTDASPYYRVFNPVTQGQRFDPDGDYVRRWVPELREVSGSAVHEPWKLTPPPADYPAPIVDHAAERIVALELYQSVKASQTG